MVSILQVRVQLPFHPLHLYLRSPLQIEFISEETQLDNKVAEQLYLCGGGEDANFKVLETLTKKGSKATIRDNYGIGLAKYL